MTESIGYQSIIDVQSVTRSAYMKITASIPLHMLYSIVALLTQNSHNFCSDEISLYPSLMSGIHNPHPKTFFV